MNSLAWFLGTLTAKLLDPVSIICVMFVFFFVSSRFVVVYSTLISSVFTTMLIFSTTEKISIVSILFTLLACFIWSILLLLISKLFRKPTPP